MERGVFGVGRLGGMVGLALAVLLVAEPLAYTEVAGKPTVIKVAVAFPRSQKAAIQVKRYNRRLAELTGNQVQFRMYWGGAAGSDRAVLRKMRMGQIDAAPFGLEMVSNFVREALVLQSPGLFANYKQVDAVREALTPEFDAEAYEKGFKILGWADVGRLRLFSKQRISRPEHLKTVRPWLYPESETLKTFYRLVGATGVPLGIAEVYGAMETGMIDTFWATSAIASALQWHRTGKFVSADGLGFVSGAFVLRRPIWDALPAQAREAVMAMIAEERSAAQREMRVVDEVAYKKLLARGYTAIETTAAERDQWWKVGVQLRKSMVGRVYSPALVKRAEDIALQFADERQRARLRPQD